MKKLFLGITLLGIILIVLFFVFIKFRVPNLKKPTGEVHQNEVGKPGQTLSGIKTYTTRSGKTITVEDTHPVGMSLSTVIITSVGFEIDKPITLTDIDPLQNVLLSDLDGDGFDEIYLIAQSAGSGSYGQVFGFASKCDKSLIGINTENLNSADRDTDLFSGYMGHETYNIKEGDLVITFPVYNENDSNAEPTGGTKEIHYSLVCSESGLQLKLKK